ncbi:MAG: hypothetical protein ABL951_16935 [Alphaproteobacteria bacterium]
MMNTETTISIHGAKPVQLISEVLFMLSTCALHHVCPGRARVVAHQLALITGNPEIDPLLRMTCRQLLDSWENTVRRFAQQVEEEEALQHIH